MHALDRLTDEQRERLLALAQHAEVPAGTDIIREGRATPGLVLLTDGTVRIEKDHLGGRVPVDQLAAGELLGEVSYLLDSAATASVVAEDHVRIAVIPRTELDRLLDSDPMLASAVFRSWAEVLAARLDRRTGDVVGTFWSWG
jgi:CRP-like cAMP-binding protein